MSKEFPKATLANWRQYPWSVWGFSHVEELIPVAPIRTGLPVTPFLPGPQLDLGRLSFDAAGTRRSVEQALAETFTDGFLVLKDGAVVAESPLNQGPGARHIVFSVTKSITAMLAGILVGQGKLDPDASVTRYVPEAAGSAYGDCRLRHVLDMTVSIRFTEDYLDTQGDLARYRVAMGWNPPGGITSTDGLHAFLVKLPKADHPHGERFHYVSPNSDLLGWIIERAAGDTLADLLSRHIWQPMGMEADAVITLDRHGAARAAGGVCATLADLARFGDMVRLKGSYNGRRIVPESWIDDILHNGDAAAWSAGDMAAFFPQGRYRSKWYIPEPSSSVVCAIGIHGQWIYVDHDAGVVAVKLSSQPLPVDDALDRMTLDMFRAIAAELRA